MASNVGATEAQFLSAGMDFVVNASDTKQAIARLVKAAADCVGSDMGSFYIVDGGVLRPYVTHNFPPHYAEACAAVPIGTQCCGRAVLHKMPWIVEDMWTDPLFADAREGAMRDGIRSAFSIPVMDANMNCLGSLAAQFKQHYTPDPYALERQSLFAKLIAFALVKHGEITKAAAQQ